MAQKIAILNGPNLNKLGTRQPEVYGAETLADIEANCRALAAEQGQEITFQQTNSEGALVEMIHEATGNADAIIINPAAFTHTSVAVLDALLMFEGTVIEVHLSNTHKREAFRHHSYVSNRSDGIIMGMGSKGYLLALKGLAL